MSLNSFRFVINSGPDSSFILPVYNVNYDIVVDWGDGIIQNINGLQSSDIVHNYSNSNENYIIDIEATANGGLPGVFFKKSANNANKLLSIIQWGVNNRFINCTDSFIDCINMTIAATDNPNIFSDSTSMDRCFNNCQSLTNEFDGSINLNKRYNINTNGLQYTWANCINLQKFNYINLSSVTGIVYYTWLNCIKLVEFKNVDISSATELYNCWENCSSLELVENVNLSNIINITGETFKGCSSLKYFRNINLQSLISVTYQDMFADTIIEEFINVDMQNCTSAVYINVNNIRIVDGWDYRKGFCFQLRNSNTIEIIRNINLSEVPVQQFVQTFNINDNPNLTLVENIDLSNIITVDSFFCTGCTGLKIIRNLNYQNVTTFSYYTNSIFNQIPNLEEIDGINLSSLVNLDYAFISIPNVKKISNIDAPLANTAVGAWAGCTMLETLENINVPNVQNFNAAWAQTGLKVFSNLNFPSGISFVGAWNNSSIEEFSNNTFPIADNFSLAFSECKQLVEFNDNDLSHISIFNGTWQLCENLIRFNGNNMSSGVVLDYTWYSCGLLESFGDNDISKAESLIQTWHGCWSLKNFDDYDLSKCEVFEYTWAYTGLLSFDRNYMDTAVRLEATWMGCPFTSFPDYNFDSVEIVIYAWGSCYNMKTFLSRAFANTKTFNGAMSNCHSLTSIPNDLYLPLCDDISNAWLNCSSLEVFPTLYLPSVNILTGAWQGCISLKSFPNIELFNASNAQNAWSDCINLETFNVSRLGGNSGIDLTAAWVNCTSLQYIPFINFSLYNTRVKSLKAAFLNCRNLKHVKMIDSTFMDPDGLDFAFINCEKLESIEGINAPNLTSLIQTFVNCTSLKTLGDSHLENIADFTDAFLDVRFSPEYYQSLLQNLSTAGTIEDIYLDVGQTKYPYQALAYRDELINLRNWTIIDGGLLNNVSNGIIIGGCIIDDNFLYLKQDSDCQYTSLFISTSLASNKELIRFPFYISRKDTVNGKMRFKSMKKIGGSDYNVVIQFYNHNPIIIERNNINFSSFKIINNKTVIRNIELIPSNNTYIVSDNENIYTGKSLDKLEIFTKGKTSDIRYDKFRDLVYIIFDNEFVVYNTNMEVIKKHKLNVSNNTFVNKKVLQNISFDDINKCISLDDTLLSVNDGVSINDSKLISGSDTIGKIKVTDSKTFRSYKDGLYKLTNNDQLFDLENATTVRNNKNMSIYSKCGSTGKVVEFNYPNRLIIHHENKDDKSKYIERYVPVSVVGPELDFNQVQISIHYDTILIKSNTTYHLFKIQYDSDIMYLYTFTYSGDMNKNLSFYEDGEDIYIPNGDNKIIKLTNTNGSYSHITLSSDIKFKIINCVDYDNNILVSCIEDIGESSFNYDKFKKELSYIGALFINGSSVEITKISNTERFIHSVDSYPILVKGVDKLNLIYNTSFAIEYDKYSLYNTKLNGKIDTTKNSIHADNLSIVNSSNRNFTKIGNKSEYNSIYNTTEGILRDFNTDTLYKVIYNNGAHIVISDLYTDRKRIDIVVNAEDANVVKRLRTDNYDINVDETFLPKISAYIKNISDSELDMLCSMVMADTL